MLCMGEETSLDTAFSNICAHSPVRLIKAKKSPNPRSTDVLLRLAGYGPLSHQLTSRIDSKRAGPGERNTCAQASVIPVNKAQKGLARLDLYWDAQCCAPEPGMYPGTTSAADTRSSRCLGERRGESSWGWICTRKSFIQIHGCHRWLGQTGYHEVIALN